MWNSYTGKVGCIWDAIKDMGINIIIHLAQQAWQWLVFWVAGQNRNFEIWACADEWLRILTIRGSLIWPWVRKVGWLGWNKVLLS